MFKYFHKNIAKLRLSSNPSWTELVLISINPATRQATYPPNTPEKTLQAQ